MKLKDVKYSVINKHTKEVHLFRFKTDVAKHLGISVRTLDRNMPYENEKWLVLNQIFVY